ncbi:hypothetical protein RFI_28524, partial [Reticulomyxa filosa]
NDSSFVFLNVPFFSLADSLLAQHYLLQYKLKLFLNKKEFLYEQYFLKKFSNMGNHYSNGKKYALNERQSKIIDFLQEKLSAEDLWLDVTNQSTKSQQERVLKNDQLAELIYVCLAYFCTKRNPTQQAPNRTQCKPYINAILNQLNTQIPHQNDGINRKQFTVFAEYLRKEYTILENELNLALPKKS